MKVLIISTVGLKYEGITSVILSNLKAMDLLGLEIYVAGTIEVNDNIKKDIEKLGCKVIDFPNRKLHTFSYFISLLKFIFTKKIDVIHAHGNSGTLAIELVAAFMGGCRHRIVHSHNTRCEQVKVDKVLRPLFNMLYTDALACGKEAGNWLFGKRKFTIMNNGRDIDTFVFDEKVRAKVRAEYELTDEVVVGHVGGFIPQKNHEYLVEIYRAIHKIEPNTVFFMIGDGELRQHIEKKIKNYGLEANIFFTGITDQVPQLLQAMDAMILPSYYEGLPLVAIEWQIASLPCVVSDVISSECVITELIEFCSLSDNPQVWAEKILSQIKKTNRIERAQEVRLEVEKAGFDIKENAQTLRELYMST